MQTHENLFNHYESKAAVYKKLQDDYQRDQKHSRWCMNAFVLLLMVAGFLHDSVWNKVMLFGAGVALFQFLIFFIELSNRNFLMHCIDWFEASDRDHNE